MNVIAEYKGRLLNHVEALYRPGERELAIELVQALGCAITDTGFQSDRGSTFLAIHPNLDDRDIQSNVFYISEMTHEQQAVEDRLRRLVSEDGGFRDSLEKYRDKARGRPFGVPHFALNCQSREEVEAVVQRINESLLPRLKDRLHVKVFRPEDPDRAGADIIQCFLYQDIIVSGAFLLGQLIEIQSYAAK